MPETEKFNRSLNLWQGLGLAVSFVAGSGLLGLPGIVLEAIGPRFSALSWMLTPAIMIPLIIVFSRLGVLFPSSPGLLGYAEEAFGKYGRNAASLVLLICFLLGMPALMMIAGSYIQVLAGVDVRWIPAFSLAVLTISVGLNLLGIKTTSAFNTLSVVVLVLFVILLAVVRTAYFNHGMAVASESVVDFIQLKNIEWRPLWKGSTLIFWAFLGWESLSFAVQEFKDPKRTVPIIFGGSFIIVTLIYWGFAFTSTGAMLAGVPGVQTPSGVIAILKGSAWEPSCLLVIILLIMGNANAWVYSGSRFFFAEAQEGVLPRSLAHLSERGIPVRCFVTIYGLTFLFTAFWSFGNFSIADLILLVNQNVLFLFLASVWAYAKCDPSPWRLVVLPFAVLACLLFLSGFSWWILFPVLLIVLGLGLTYMGRKQKRGDKLG